MPAWSGKGFFRVSHGPFYPRGTERVRELPEVS